MKKFLSLALAVAMLTMFVGCKQAPDEPEVKDWTPIMQLSQSELQNLMANPAEWESDAMDPSEYPYLSSYFYNGELTFTFRIIYGWDRTDSWMTIVNDFSGNTLTVGEKNEVKTRLEGNSQSGTYTPVYSWEGDCLYCKVSMGYTQGKPTSIGAISNGEISAGRKTVRVPSMNNQYLYYRKK